MYRGRGTVTSDPDLVWLTFAIQGLALEYSEATEMLNQRINQLRKAIQSVGIAPETLKTTVLKTFQNTMSSARSFASRVWLL